jgi:hypothetical protein
MKIGRTGLAARDQELPDIFHVRLGLNPGWKLFQCDKCRRQCLCDNPLVMTGDSLLWHRSVLAAEKIEPGDQAYNRHSEIKASRPESARLISSHTIITRRCASSGYGGKQASAVAARHPEGTCGQLLGRDRLPRLSIGTLQLSIRCSSIHFLPKRSFPVSDEGKGEVVAWSGSIWSG